MSPPPRPFFHWKRQDCCGLFFLIFILFYFHILNGFFLICHYLCLLLALDNGLLSPFSAKCSNFLLFPTFSHDTLSSNDSNDRSCCSTLISKSLSISYGYPKNLCFKTTHLKNSKLINIVLVYLQRLIEQVD